MNLKKVIFAASVALVGSPVSFADPVSFFGKANVSLQMTDDGEGSFSELKSNSSRVGVKGDYEIDEQLTVFYHAEWQYDQADASGADNLKSRNQYIGFKGDFGSVMLGRNDSILKQSQGKIDLFNDYEADLKGLWLGENRVSDSVTYQSPVFEDFRLGVTYIAKDSLEGESGTSVALTYGDKSLKKTGWYAALAADNNINGSDNLRASFQTKFEQLTVGAIFHRQESTVTGESESGVMGSLAYRADKLTYKAQWQTLEDDDSVSVGVDYKLGSATKGYTWFSKRTHDAAEDQTWFAVGVEHKF